MKKLHSIRVAGLSAAAILTGAFAMTLPAVGAEDDAHNTSLTIDHILKMKSVSDVQISPDNKWVAYVVRRNDEKKDKRFSQIWMTSMDGKTTIPMTANYTNASSPRWNPDGKTLAFKGKRGDKKDGKTQVWLLDRNGGEAQQYTNVKQGIVSYVWSNSGEQMLLTIKDAKPENKDKETGKEKAKPWVIDRLQFKADYVGYLDRRRTHFYVFDGTSKPVQITSGDYDDQSPGKKEVA